MVYYLVYSYDGPMVYVDAGSRWMVISPGHRPEIFAGKLPERCRCTAIRITAAEVQSVLGTVDELISGAIPAAS